MKNILEHQFKKQTFFVLFPTFTLFMIYVLYSFLNFRYLNNTWINELMEVKKKYATSIEGRKIILLGHSGLLFSINSPEIEKSIGIPVVNMGLHGGFPFSFFWEKFKDTLKDGDVLIIFTTEPQGNNQTLSLYLMEYDKYRYLTTTGIFSQVENFQYFLMSPEKIFFPTKLDQNATLYNNSFYSLSHLNKNGDLLNNFTQSLGTAPKITSLYSINQNTFNDILAFTKTHKIDLYEGYYASQKQYSANYSYLTNLPKIGKQDDFLYPEECFYDSEYHLTSICREIHTKRFTSALKNALNNK